MGFLNKVKAIFKNTSEKISASISGKRVDENLALKIEEGLILADVGAETSARLAKKVSDRKFHKETTELEIKKFLADSISSILKPYESGFFDKKFSHNPEIILFIGVNGSGKTTTIAKIAGIFKEARPLMVAGDTFRAAASEQLKYWADKVGADIRVSYEGADSAGLIYDSIKQASGNGVILIDTAGRVQNRDDLLAELEKIKRVIKKLDSSAPHTTILVLDGLTGQSAHNQADVFLNKIGVDGIIITKLDGTAKGGALIALTEKYKIPIFAIGVGEGVDDLKRFDAEEYSKAIVGID